MKNNKPGRLIVMLTALALLGVAGTITSVRCQDLICREGRAV